MHPNCAKVLILRATSTWAQGVVGSNPIAPTIKLLSIRELRFLQCPETSNHLVISRFSKRKHNPHHTGQRRTFSLTDRPACTRSSLCECRRRAMAPAVLSHLSMNE